MKVAIVTESFLPRMNGVTNSVCRVVEHLAGRGHEVLTVAPGPGPGDHAGHPVRSTPGIALPFYRSFPTRQVVAVLRDFAPDVVHLASPLLLGTSAIAAARRLDVPTVAVFQTDLAGFVHRYGLRGVDPVVWAWLRHIHEKADRTLVPSRPTLEELRRRGFQRLRLWARGVDDQRFHPRHRSPAVRARLAPGGEVLVGYVGRLAAEKRPGLLSHLADLPGVRLVVVGVGKLGSDAISDLGGEVGQLLLHDGGRPCRGGGRHPRLAHHGGGAGPHDAGRGRRRPRPHATARCRRRTDEDYCRYPSTWETLAGSASSGFAPAALRARRRRIRSQH